MPRTHTYRVDVFEVELVEADEDAVRPWDRETCECPRFAERDRSHRVQRQDDVDCQHIRTAKLFHELNKMVTRVRDDEEEDVQQSIGEFVAD